ncbi:DMT family transporter [Sorangium sp. So ce341]|uniref:DMT family transporter n=1 Tax=Sorangium sp. So ce341 TaxID=3133302 RepID=UPI003F5E88AF
MATPERTAHRRGGAYGLAASALFGASAPLAKLLLPHAGPLVLAALLYLGAGVGLTLIRLLAARDPAPREAALRKTDVALLAGVVLFGGLVGPVLMLFGLARVSGLAGSLLLNLEAPLTMALAVLVFREHLGRRAAGAAALIVAGAALLGVRPGELHASAAGVAAIAGACLSWAIDNNLSQRLTLRDPLAVVQIKTLGAGACATALALLGGQQLPGPSLVAPALLLGCLSYGVSLVLDMKALRILGAAREAAYFATAPFIGAILSVPLLGDRPGATDLAAAGLMLAGVALLRSEQHAHTHTHVALDHDHVHTHDEHHHHAHVHPHAALDAPHAHPHRHEPLSHAHPHVPDLHHRHEHD